MTGDDLSEAIGSTASSIIENRAELNPTTTDERFKGDGREGGAEDEDENAEFARKEGYEENDDDDEEDGGEAEGRRREGGGGDCVEGASAIVVKDGTITGRPRAAETRGGGGEELGTEMEDVREG